MIWDMNAPKTKKDQDSEKNDHTKKIMNLCGFSHDIISNHGKSM